VAVPQAFVAVGRKAVCDNRSSFQQGATEAGARLESLVAANDITALARSASSLSKTACRP